MGAERVDSILENLPHWWAKSPESRTYKILLSLVSELDGLSDETARLHLEVFVNAATGIYLDDLGKIFKLTRLPSETDDSFRQRIKAFVPSFQGGGTLYAIKRAISDIMEIPVGDIAINEFEPMKLRISVPILTPEQMLRIPATKSTVLDVKAAGIFPFYEWLLSGELLTEDMAVSDVAEAKHLTELPWFIWESSLIDGGKLLW